MADYPVSNSFCLEQGCLYNLSSLLWYLGGLNSTFGPYVKCFYCSVSDTCLISALFAVLLNSAGEGIGCPFSTKVGLKKPQKPHLPQVPDIAVILLVTARDPHLGLGWLGCRSQGDSFKEVPTSFSRLVMIKTRSGGPVELPRSLVTWVKCVSWHWLCSRGLLRLHQDTRHMLGFSSSATVTYGSFRSPGTNWGTPL